MIAPAQVGREPTKVARESACTKRERTNVGKKPPTWDGSPYKWEMIADQESKPQPTGG